MDSNIILGRILQRFIDKGYAQVNELNKFGFIRYTAKSVYVTREEGKDTAIPFAKIKVGIKAYQQTRDLYDSNTTALRKLGITHVTSPVYALLHLLKKEDYMLGS